MGIVGQFYLKETSNGNIVGEFSNNLSDGIYSMSGDLLDGEGGFIGTYRVTWREKNEGIFTYLNISYLYDNNKLFKLTWTDSKKKELFEGEGMLCDDALIGNYRSS
ncbi:MAG: hypothetical protein FWF73_02225 [Spirochaetes bacterium]|nr:hypothetical protein [Spirochaetota bacterium]